MTYKVTYLPENKSKESFRTLKDASDYIAESFCDECLKEYIDHGTHGLADREEKTLKYYGWLK